MKAQVAFLTTSSHRPSLNLSMAEADDMLNGRKEGRRPAPVERERRAAPRLDKVFRVFLEGERGMGLGVARNISEGGMFVETREPHPIGSQVRITFPSDAGEMTAVAEVRYVCHLMGRAPAGDRGPLALRGMGVKFLYFEDDAVHADLQ
jgi:PilZ domain-containing protein